MKSALQVLLDHSGLGISKKKTTISTSGIVPVIEKFANDFPGMTLAVSLHAPTDELRYGIIALKQYRLCQ